MEYETAGDPMTGLKWTKRTTRKIAAELANLNIHVSHSTVGKLLHRMGYSLRVNQKQLVCGTSAPLPKEVRNQQFEYISQLREAFTVAGNPVVSVDTNYARVGIMHGLRTGRRPAIWNMSTLRRNTACDDLRSVRFYLA
jgi:hypothetical protein